MVAPVKSYELAAAQRSMLSDSKAFEWNLNTAGQRQGSLGSISCQDSIPLNPITPYIYLR